MGLHTFSDTTGMFIVYFVCDGIIHGMFVVYFVVECGHICVYS